MNSYRDDWICTIIPLSIKDVSKVCIKFPEEFSPPASYQWSENRPVSVVMFSALFVGVVASFNLPVIHAASIGRRFE